MYCSPADTSFNPDYNAGQATHETGQDEHEAGKVEHVQNRPIRVYWRSCQNNSDKAAHDTGKATHETGETTTHGERPPSGVLPAASAPSVGEGQCLSRQNNGGCRLAKQPNHRSQTLAFTADTFGYPVANVPTLCGKYKSRKFRDTTAKFFPCGSATCAYPDCRRKWAMKEHNILRESFKTHPPTYFCVISFQHEPKYHDCSRWLRLLHKRNKYRDKSYQCYTQVELSERGLFHVHYLTRTVLDDEAIRQSIKRTIPVEHVAYVQPCRDPQATARYITKDKPGHAGVRFPFAYKGQGKRLTGWSKNFFAASRAELWEQAKQGFAAKKPRRGDTKDDTSDTTGG